VAFKFQQLTIMHQAEVETLVRRRYHAFNNRDLEVRA
jgi:hypothetical protein